MLESLKSAVRTGLGRIAARLKPEDYGYQEDLVAYVNEEWRRRRDERRPFELQWRLNMAFVDGNQYLDMDVATMDLREIPALYQWQEREVFNHVAPIVETRVARLSRMQPTLKVRPATGEPEDLSGAKVCTRLLEYVQHERLTPEQKQTLIQWAEVCGTAFLKNVWNPKAGRVIGAVAVRAEHEGKPQEEPPQKEPDGSGLEVAGKLISEVLTPEVEEPVAVSETEGGTVAATIQPVHEGDVDVVIVPPYEIYPDSPWNPTIDACRSILHARAYHVEQIYEIWGVRVEPEPADSFGLLKTTMGLAGLGYGFGMFYQSTTKLEGYAVVKEMWERPSLRYPNGRLIVVANDKVLHVGPLPYQIGPDGTVDLPFTKFESIRRPGCFWGRAVVERLIPIQRRYNALRNRKAEYLNRCAIGQMWVEEGACDLEDLEENGAAPGYIVVVKKGFAPPQYLQNPALPAAFENEEATLLNEFTIISGVSEIARHSQAPPGVKSGVALSIAIEQDDTRISHTVANMEQALVKAGKQWLRLYRQFATGTRLLRTVGADLEVELTEWDASDIRSDDVVIETSAMLAQSPAQRMQMIFDLMQAGFFNDPETGRLSREGRAKVLELLQFGHWEFGVDDTERMHVARAEKENRHMVQGMAVQVDDFDNDTLHLARHLRYRLTEDYEQINQRSGGVVDAIFKQHIVAHIQRVMAAMQPPQQGGIMGGGKQAANA